jgi:hypothetical protein
LLLGKGPAWPHCCWAFMAPPAIEQNPKIGTAIREIITRLFIHLSPDSFFNVQVVPHKGS